MFSHHSLHFLLHNKLSEFYMMFILRSLGFSMINLFLPIFIFGLRNSLFDLITFFFFQFLTALIFSPFAAKLSTKIGNAHTMLFSSPFLILFFFLLYYFNPLKIGLVFLGFLIGFSEAFFWLPFHEEFSFISKTKKMGKEIGVYRIFGVIIAMLGPALGAIIIVFLGFNFLFLLTILLLLICQIPLLLSKDIKPRQKFVFKNIFKLEKFPDFLQHISIGAISFSTMVLWPLFLFLIIIDFLIIGSISILAQFANIFMIFVVGKKINSKNSIIINKIGAVLFSLTVIIRAFVSNIFQATIVWIFGGIFWPLFSIPVESRVYEKSKHSNKLEFFVARELFLNLGRFFMLFILFIFVSDLFLAISTSFFVSGVFLLFSYFVW
jgi:MFS transporter, YQGE family, putative transporter